MQTEELNASRAIAGKYLTFKLGREWYGISVLKIREIIRLTDITAVPQMPEYVKGVINLRGKIIPVTDLRVKFGIVADADTQHTCIVVVQIALSSGVKVQTGLIVDGVEEVINIAQNEIEETPDFGAGLDTDCLLGIAKVKGVVKTLLDIDRVFTANAIAQIEPVAAGA